MLDMVLLLNEAEIDVIGNPHILENLKEETFFELLLGEHAYELLLLEVESKKGNQESSSFCFLD